MSEVTNEQLLTELKALRAEVQWLRDEWDNRHRQNWRNADAYNRMLYPDAKPQGQVSDYNAQYDLRPSKVT